MKLKAIIFGVAIASMFSIPALASMGSSAQETLRLERGISPTQILTFGHPKRFQLDIDRPTTLNVASVQLSSLSSQGSQISASLYDSNGRKMAMASSKQGHFLLSRQLQPGTYELEVSGWPAGKQADDLSNRYELHVSY